MSITTHETKYVEQPKGSRRRRFGKIAIAIVALVAVVAAILIWSGHNSADRPAPSAHVRTVPKNSLPVGEASADLSLSTKVVGGEPRGFPHTEAGAIEAATAADQGVARLLNHPAAENKEFIRDAFINAPDISAVIARKKAELGLDTSGELLHPLEGDRYYNDSLYQFGAYQVDLGASDYVNLSIWTPTLYGPGRPESVDQLKIHWDLTAYKMQWANGDWRVSNGYGDDTAKTPLPPDIDRVDVSFKERRQLLGSKWNLYQGATEKWPVDLLGPAPQGSTE